MTYLKRKRVFVDVGAHIGHFVFNALGVFKEVIAFEPVPANFQCLERNVAARQEKTHKKTSVRLFNAAVGKEQLHKPDVWYKDPSNGENSGAWELSLTDTGGALLKTDVLTLDALDLRVCDLIKIDTQGWESEVIKGGVKTLEACRPILIVEMINERTFNDSLMEEIMALNYRMHAMVQKNGIFKYAG